jgi:hypothetical protein
MANFRDCLTLLINDFSKENGSATPDYILAQYLCDCLAAFDKAVIERTAWYAPPQDDSTQPAGGPTP